MKVFPYKKFTIFSLLFLVAIELYSCFNRYRYVEEYMPEYVEMSQRLHSQFSQKKLLCFGRYALEVPGEAGIIFGDASFPSPINFFDAGTEGYKILMEENVKKIKSKDKTAQITYNSHGPSEKSWQIRYYEGEIAREYKLHFFKTYRTIGNLTFELNNSIDEGEVESAAVARDNSRIINLRLRDNEEVPEVPGYCIDRGFVNSSNYREQEMVSVGIDLPNFPDVTFSIQSNKDAYSDYPAADFEKMKIEELPLLARIKKAQDDQGLHYPARTVLREGKRAVQHWKGEESLIRRADGTHDFEWAFVGTPKDVANPSEFNVTMFTKVAHNMVGAAEKASLTDDEAIALWDKLLSGLKFRVKVPGAPKGSYYFPQETGPGANP